MGASPEEKHPVLSQQEDCRCNLRATGLFVAFILLVTGTCWYGDQSTMAPEYSVAITAISGLNDPAAADVQRGSGRGMLYPVFNMTVGLASRSVASGGCIEPGTAVRVSYSYLRLPMASGCAPDMCVGPRQSAERAVVARGREVAMPGFLVDSLAEEMRRGEATFEVKLTSLEVEERWKVVTCWVRAGSAGGLKPCVESFTRMQDMPEPQPGDFGYVQHPIIPAAVPVPP